MIARIQTRQERKLARRGFTLMEMLVVVAIIVVLAGLGGYYLMGRLDDTKEKAAWIKANNISGAAKQYKVDKGDFPGNLGELVQPSDGSRPYLESADDLKDPWGKSYEYDPTGSRNGGRSPDVWTRSPSGAEIGNWMKK